MNRLFRALLNYFLKGVLIVLPLGAAIYVTWWAVSSLDRGLNITDRFAISTSDGQTLYIPGLGILTVLLIILLAGIVVTNFITDPIKAWFGRWLKRLPLFNFLYSSIKDLTEAFVGDEKKFNEPVTVDLNDGTKRIGFLTQKDLSAIDLPGEVAVYFPWSYSFAGQLSIVSKDRVKPLKMSGTEAMKFVVSGGVAHL